MAGVWDNMPVSARTDRYGYPTQLSPTYERLWYNEARHLWCFYVSTESAWTVAQSLVPVYEMGDGTTMHVVPNLFYGGREVFAGGEGNGARILFFSPYLDVWVYRDGGTIVEPRSYKDLDNLTVLGDAWYAGYFGELPYPGNGNPPRTSLEPDGTATGSNMTLTLKWPRWKKRSGDAVVNDSIHPVNYPPCGVYKAVDQTADDVVIGTPIWRDGSGNRYQRSDSKDKNGYWSYGSIRMQDGFWSPAGESYPRSANEPNRDSPTPFFDKAGNIAFELSFYGLGTGAQTATRYIGEACVWRA